MESRSCPNCRSSTVVQGHVRTNDDFASWFVPVHTSGNGMPLHDGHLCLSCGHLWSNFAPDKLRAHIDKYGSELIKERLGPLGTDPNHDVPNCPEALQAAQGVTEIDALVLESELVQATRRYRELTHTKWG